MKKIETLGTILLLFGISCLLWILNYLELAGQF